MAERQLAQSSGKGGLEFKTSGLDGKSADRDRPAAISQPILEMELRNEDGGGKFIMASSNERISRRGWGKHREAGRAVARVQRRLTITQKPPMEPKATPPKY